MKLLAVDPGRTTGVAIFSLDPATHIYEFATNTYSDHTEVWSLFNSSIAAVICEQFSSAGRQMSGHGLHTVRLIGSLEHACWMHKILFVTQPPQLRKAQLHQSVKLLGKYVEHRSDALAHLLAFMRARHEPIYTAIFTPLDPRMSTQLPPGLYPGRRQYAPR
jgi:hypothetical protein